MGSSRYTVERQRRIDASASDLFERIVDFRRWQAWSPWEDIDPDLKRTYSGADSGVGAVYEWSGNRKAGEGRMEITGAEPDARVDVDLQFKRPFKSRSTTVFTLAADRDGTVVTWTMTGPKTFMTKVMGIFTSMDKVIGPDFEKGLERLETDITT